jgi:hypothetical protein
MGDTKTRVEGSCLCGAVRFEVSPPSLFCAHCHCAMCRRSHGAAYVTWFAVPFSQFEVTQGKGELRRRDSSDHGARSFCGRCGSSLFCESTKHPESIDIVLANMEGAIDKAPEAHVYYSDRASWVEIDDELPKLGGPGGLDPLE